MKVALFVTCLVDTLRPEIGFATLKLLKAAGCEVSVPEQACCGQVNYNSGDVQAAKQMALKWLAQFDGFDYVVIPSGSCAAMIKIHYAGLLQDEVPDIKEKLKALSAKTFELSQFLTQIATVKFAQNRQVDIGYHDSCSGLRALGIKQQPRELLIGIKGVTIKELDRAETCCGFGGSFCVKHPEIACKLADDKLSSIKKSGVKRVLGGDWGCLMHLKARFDAREEPVELEHFSEFLARALDE